MVASKHGHRVPGFWPVNKLFRPLRSRDLLDKTKFPKPLPKAVSGACVWVCQWRREGRGLRKVDLFRGGGAFPQEEECSQGTSRQKEGEGNGCLVMGGGEAPSFHAKRSCSRSFGIRSPDRKSSSSPPPRISKGSLGEAICFHLGEGDGDEEGASRNVPDICMYYSIRICTNRRLRLYFWITCEQNSTALEVIVRMSCFL